MTYANKEEALEAAADMALEGKLPSTDEVEAMLAVGVDFRSVHSILQECFYEGEEFTNAEPE